MKKNPKSLFTLADHSSELNDNDYRKVAAWFLGPKAENGKQFLSLLDKSISEHIEVRKNYYEDEEPYIDESITHTKEYQDALKLLDEKRENLSKMLKNSVPFFSQRYQGHMLWDTLMAGNLGYITAMLYNQNNVATEASPVTSHLEFLVGKQLCKLMEFPKKSSWGHITADGTIANIEAVWAARNMKAYVLAIREMLLSDELSFPNQQQRLPQIKADTMLDFMACSNWQLLNLQQETVWSFFDALAAEYHFTPEELNEKLEPYLLRKKGIAWYSQKYPEFSRIKMIIPTTHHYSWTKAASLLGMGEDSIIRIPVDEECKMDMEELGEKLKHCLQEQNPVLITVSVIGSTAEGAVDNLKEIIQYRKTMRMLGLNFHIHCDAAWGGYMRTMLINPDKTSQEFKPSYFKTSHSVYNLSLSDYALEQYKAIPEADTLTVDPHKAGFIPYPAGALCYRDKRLREQIVCDASYIHSNSEENMGIYGLEGSKPGAAAAAVWLAHETVPLDKSGYGLILGECSYTSKLNYCNWLCMSGDIEISGSSSKYTFTVSPLIPLPKILISGEEDGYSFSSYKDVLQYIEENIIDKDMEEISKNKRALYILRNVGADVLINPFVVNFKKDGVYNTDLDIIRDLNNKLFEEFSLSDYKENQEPKPHPKFILMMNKLSSKEYGKAFDHMMKEWGMSFQNDTNDSSSEFTLNVLVNTVMQPWPNTSESMNYMKKVFKEGVAKVLKEVIK